MEEHIIEHFPNEKRKTKHIKIPRELQNMMIHGKQESFNIHTLRIFGRILSRIKKNQILNGEQLELFSDKYLKTNKSLVSFEFNYKDFSPENYTNIQPIKNALLDLKKYKDNTWHKMKTIDGRELIIVGGLIMNPSIDLKTKKVTFNMNAYWFDKFLNLSPHFNKSLLDIYFKTNSMNTSVFYNYLLTLKKEGTSMKLETFNSHFNTNYSKISELKRSFLEKVREELNTISDLSFNYSTDRNNPKYISIVPYYTNNVQAKHIEKDKKDSKKRRKFIYLKKKHALDNKQIEYLKLAFNKYGFDILKLFFDRNKANFKGLEGAVFIDKLINQWQIFTKSRPHLFD